MATIDAPAPTAHERVRPEWLENIGGQLLALVAALVIALLLGSVIILAYGESPVAVYGAILTFSFGSRDGFGYVISIATRYGWCRVSQPGCRAMNPQNDCPSPIFARTSICP